MNDSLSCIHNNHLSLMILRQVSEVSTKSLRLSLVTMIPSVFSARWSMNLTGRKKRTLRIFLVFKNIVCGEGAGQFYDE